MTQPASEAGKMIRDVAAARYLKPGEASLEDIYRRAAAHVFPDDPGLAEKYATLMTEGAFMPNSPLLMNAGDRWGTLSACFVCPVGDSLVSFMTMLTIASRIFQEGGGVGVNFGSMRPAGSPVRGSDGVASGPVSFIRMYDMLADTIKQGGKRRAAEMAILPVDHPDIEAFLAAKYEEGTITNANLSVRIPDAFMRAVEADGDWDLRFDGKVYRTIKARDLMQRIAAYAWRNGEPGVQFADTITRGDTCPHLPGMYDTSNPCVTGDTLVLTREGNVPIRDLVGREVEVWNGRWWSAVTPRRTGRYEPVVEVTAEGGHRLCCTPYHTMICVKGDPADLDHLVVIKKPASALVPGDRLLVVSPAGTIGPELFPRSLSIHTVERITDAGVADEVFCFSEPHLNKGVFNGILTGNCGEQFLRTDLARMAGECCTLGHVNLAKCVKDGQFDYDRLAAYVADAVRFLDTVIDRNVYPTPEIAEMVRETRKIGVGVMGLADALILMDLAYDSPEGAAASLAIAEAFDDAATMASRELAGERGVFPAWEGSTWHRDGIAIRNAMVTTVAPTGTTAQFAGCSGGIEPTLLVYERKNTVGGAYFVIHPHFEARLRRFVYNEMIGIWDETEQNARFKEVIEHAFRHGTIRDLDWLPEEMRRVFVTGLDVSWQYHLRHLEAWQQNVHNSISKCLAKGTLVQTNRGVIPIECLGAAKGTDVFADPVADLKVIDKDGNWRAVTRHYSGGTQPTIKVRFDNGFEIEGSQVHRVMTNTGWKMLSDLAVGDLVENRRATYTYSVGGLPINTDVPVYHDGNHVTKVHLPDRMSVDLAKLLGMICADGHVVERTGSVGLTTADNDVEALFSSLMKKVFDVQPRRRLDPRTKNTRTVLVGSRKLARYLAPLIGVSLHEPRGSRTKHAPRQIVEGSREEMIAFIEGVTLDGYVKQSRNVTGQHYTQLVLYEGYSKTLRDQIAAMLVHLGCAPYLGEKDVYFEKTLRGQTYSVSIDTDIVVPIEHHKQIPTTRKDRLVRSDFVLPVVQQTNTFVWSKLQYLSRYCGIIKDKTCERHGIGYDPAVFYTKVTAIKPSEAEVFDIEVEDTHSYLVNGIVSHNTISMSESATVDDVLQVYTDAWKCGVKGVTVYRQGSREDEVYSLKKEAVPPRLPSDWERPEWLPAWARKTRCGCGTKYVIVTYASVNGHQMPVEIFVPSGEGCHASDEGETRLISKMLQLNVTVAEIDKQLNKVKCPTAMLSQKQGQSSGHSCPDIVGNTLKTVATQFLNQPGADTAAPKPAAGGTRKSATCPSCGAALGFAEGCGNGTCRACGWSGCT